AVLGECAPDDIWRAIDRTIGLQPIHTGVHPEKALTLAVHGAHQEQQRTERHLCEEKRASWTRRGARGPTHERHCEHKLRPQSVIDTVKNVVRRVEGEGAAERSGAKVEKEPERRVHEAGPEPHAERALDGAGPGRAP